MSMTPRLAMQIPWKKLPLGGVASCPCCTFAVALRRPLNWGTISKAKGEVWQHYITAHPQHFRTNHPPKESKS